MFNLFKNMKLESANRELQDRIDSRDNDIKRLEAQIKKMQLDKVDAIKTDVNTSEFVIDWNNMDVFSVERMGDHQSAYSVIGYYMYNETEVKEVREWKFYCSHEQHNKLAEEFRNAISAENNSSVR